MERYNDYLWKMFGLDGRVAVVTGASRGLGQSMSVALGRAGARLCLVGRQPNLDRTREMLEGFGCECIEVVCDQKTTEGVRQIIDAALGKWGRIDILVNNAGTFIRKPCAEWTDEDWDTVMNLNLRSVFLMCREIGKIMIAQGKGKIINISSILGFQGGLLTPAYPSSRHGVLGLTKSLANEWAPLGVNVNAIAPGYMDTDQNIDLFKDPVRSKELMARIPAKRWGYKNELDGACLFLASDASSYMHGQVIVVDGGWMGR